MKPPLEPLPLDDTGALVVPAAIATALRYFNGLIMQGAAFTSTKLSKATIGGAPAGIAVPNEAAYHSQLFVVLQSWLHVWRHALVLTEAASDSRAAKAASGKKMYTDLLLLLVGRSAGAPKHILELAASTDNADVDKHYVRTLQYMASHSPGGAHAAAGDPDARGATITFTAVQTAQQVGVVKAALDATAAAAGAADGQMPAVDAAGLSLPNARVLSEECSVWLTDPHLIDRLVAVHIVHDIPWTTAQLSLLQGSAAVLFRVRLSSCDDEPEAARSKSGLSSLLCSRRIVGRCVHFTPMPAATQQWPVLLLRSLRHRHGSLARERSGSEYVFAQLRNRTAVQQKSL